MDVPKERKNSIMKIDLCIGKNGEEACSACTANSASKNRNVYFFLELITITKS